MSLALRRDALLRDRKHERTASLRRHKSKLRLLNAITTSLTTRMGVSPALSVDFDANPSPPLSPSEGQLLELSDSTKGHSYHSLPHPVLEDVTKAFHFPVKEETPAVAKDAETQPTVSSNVLASQHTDSGNAQPAPEHVDVLDSDLRRKVAKASEPPINPPSFIQTSSEHRPKTIHLPPKEVQEERLNQRRQSRDEFYRRDLKEVEKATAEPPSSPSSTAGAWSTATPGPADPSPATSADDEASSKQTDVDDSTGKDAVNDLRSKSIQNIARQEPRDMSDGIHRDAIGQDFASPDVQLRLEQEQAARATRNIIMKQTSSNATSPANGPAVTVTAPAVQPEAKQPAQPSQTSVSSENAKNNAALPEPIPTTSFSQPKANNTASSSRDDKAGNDAPNTTATRHKGLPDTARISQPERGVPIKLQSSPTKRLQDDGTSRAAVSPKPRTIDSARHQCSKVEPENPIPVKTEPDLLIDNEGYSSLKGIADDPSRDYLESLYRMQVYEEIRLPLGNRPLHDLLQKSSKVVSTADQFVGLHERQDYRILRRIYGLQNANRWSLRQMVPVPEPAPPKTHMDHLLSEMKWMRTDFREERKLKKASAKFLAEMCADYVNSDETVQQTMKVKVRSTEPDSLSTAALHSPAETTFGNGDEYNQRHQKTPELEDSQDHDDSAAEDDMPSTPEFAVVPSSMFTALNLEKDSGHIQNSGDLHQAISDLPLYRPFEDDDDGSAPSSAYPLTPRILQPVSKFCHGKIMTRLSGPPKKRSRYAYEDEDYYVDGAGESHEKRLRASQGPGLSPEQLDVALFDPENKLLRDRLHSNTAFRPPSEFPMPSSQFYEFRSSSQWVAEDDQLLRRLAKEYSFNWSLIADELSLPGSLHGAPDRRTPWECFERWVELESLPNEMRKTLYFKTWNQRIQTAQTNNEARYQMQLAQQAQTPGQPQQIVRKRTAPLRVERRRTNRYLAIVDAMRKQARKREQQAHKQAEAQKAASLRKQHENAAPKSIMHTPQEFSRIRHERDVQNLARSERLRQHMIQQQREAAAQMQQRQQGHLNGQQRQGSNIPHPPNAQMQAGHPQQTAPHNQMHGRAPQQANQVPMQNGHLAVPQIGSQSNVPQAQMQPNMRGSNTNTQGHGAGDNMQQRMVLEAQRQAQLKNAQLSGHQYQMAPPNHATPAAAVHGPNGNAGGHNNQAAMMAAMHTTHQPHQQSNGNAQTPTSQPNGQMNGMSASPAMPPRQSAAVSQPQQLSSGQVPLVQKIQHHLRAQYPQATQEEIQKLTAEQLKSYQQAQNQQHRQNAMHAAAGTHNVAPSPSPANNSAAYTQNQTAFQQNNTAVNSQNPAYSNNPAAAANAINHNSPQTQQYSAMMRQQLMQQRPQLQGPMQNGSPRPPQVSPNMTHASPNMAQAVPNMTNVNRNSATPVQMARLGSSGGPQGGVQSPSLTQNSPRPVPAGVARQ